MTIQEMKERRAELGYSYAQLSELSGVPVTTIQKVFSGTTVSPRYHTIQALSSVLERGAGVRREDSVEVVHEDSIAYHMDRILPPYTRQGTYTVEDREHIPDEYRTELMDGVLYDMASPTLVHQRIVGSVYRQIADFIEVNKGTCEPFIAPIDVQLDQDNRTMVQPDVIIVCNPDLVTEQNISGAPDFVMEVTSPSTGRRDYTKKLSKYEAAGVREYWIVDTARKMVFVFFFEDSSRCPAIYPMDEKIPVNIYQSELEINLSGLMKWTV